MALVQTTIRQHAHRESLLRLIHVLRKLYEVNKRAKNCLTYRGKRKNYNKKTHLLYESLDIARNVINKHFTYGYLIDETAEEEGDPFKYVYYFQIKQYQVSFHSHVCPYQEKIPLFQGEWIGQRNKRFPFDLRRLKKYCLKH